MIKYLNKEGLEEVFKIVKNNQDALESDITQVLNGMTSTINEKANSADVYNKSEVDDLLNNLDVSDSNNIVKLTQAEYDALETKDENTLYIITDVTPVTIPDGSDVDLSNYYTKSEVDGSLLATQLDLTTYMGNNFAYKGYVDDTFATKNNTYDKTYIDGIVSNVSTQLNSKLPIDSFNQWSEGVALKDNTYTKSEVDNLIDNIETGGGTSNSVNFRYVYFSGGDDDTDITSDLIERTIVSTNVSDITPTLYDILKYIQSGDLIVFKSDTSIGSETPLSVTLNTTLIQVYNVIYVNGSLICVANTEGIYRLHYTSGGVWNGFTSTVYLSLEKSFMDKTDYYNKTEVKSLINETVGTSFRYAYFSDGNNDPTSNESERDTIVTNIMNKNNNKVTSSTLLSALQSGDLIVFKSDTSIGSETPLSVTLNTTLIQVYNVIYVNGGNVLVTDGQNTYTLKRVVVSGDEEMPSFLRNYAFILEALESSGGSADLNNYYNKTEIDSKLGDINTILENILS